ncbi:hypothetical protein ACFQJC_05060 [Haloferax namakaokahaiae]|uniref:Small CPxCG-related zinc finger protein n=1 Tax=Haloferax namakaokahaiae TaxID=1748331 RepID=A0ABD5ZC84_9EURY
MTFTCTEQVHDDCVIEGMFNAAYGSDDEPVCVMCAIELGINDHDF